MKISLIFPMVKKQVAEEAKPPLGLAYIASSLGLDNHKVMIEDMYSFQTPLEDFIEKLKRFNPDIVGLGAATPYIASAHTVASLVKKELEIPVVVGGPHPSSLPEKTLRDYSDFDFVVRGEGEETMRELVRSLENSNIPQNIMGITYRHGNEIISNPDRPLIQDIDSIPFPAWNLLSMEKYYNVTAKYVIGRKGKGFSIITSRGCPGRCTFCDSHAVWTRKLRSRSATNVVDEIETLYKKYGINYIYFCDDTFVVDKKRTMEICEQIVARDLNIKWECNARVNIIDSEVLEKMKKSGCSKIVFGVESGTQKVLDYTHKGITLEQVRHAIDITNKIGISNRAFFMMGFPIETEEDIVKTIEFNKSLPLDEHDTFSILTPFPGTELYQITKEEGLLLSEDWEIFFNRRAGKAISPIKTRYVSNERLIELKEWGDREMIKINLQKNFYYFLVRPHRLLTRFVKEPKSLLKASAWLLKNTMLKKSS